MSRPPNGGLFDRAATITDRVLEYFWDKQQVKDRLAISPEHGKVAEWLRGNTAIRDSIANLLAARISARGILPIPSTPHELAIQAGRDRECRELSLLFSELYALPVGREGEDE